MNVSDAELANRFSLDSLVAPRRIVHHVHGRQHGPIKRLVSPADIGELIKPFVFLDYANVPPADSMFGIHPHSGIATLTVVISGALVYGVGLRRRAVDAGSRRPGNTGGVR